MPIAPASQADPPIEDTDRLSPQPSTNQATLDNANSSPVPLNAALSNVPHSNNGDPSIGVDADSADAAASSGSPSTKRVSRIPANFAGISKDDLKKLGATRHRPTSIITGRSSNPDASSSSSPQLPGSNLESIMHKFKDMSQEEIAALMAARNEPQSAKPDFFEFSKVPLNEQLLSLVSGAQPLPDNSSWQTASEDLPQDSDPPWEEEEEQAFDESSQYVPPPNSPEYLPEWPSTQQMLIDIYKANYHLFLDIKEREYNLWSDFVLSLLPKHNFLRYATLVISSLLRDYNACQQEKRPFQASDLSTYLFDAALLTTGQSCNNVTPNNFEGLFFATSFISCASFRISPSVIPLYGNNQNMVDLISLSKGPLSILARMKDHLVESPLMILFSRGSHGLEKHVSTRICDNLLVVCKMLDEPPFFSFSSQLPAGMDGATKLSDVNAEDQLHLNLKNIIEVLRKGPISPPADDMRVDSSSSLSSQATFAPNPFLTKESLMYLRLNPWDPTYLPESLSDDSLEQPKDFAIQEDNEDGLASPTRSDSTESLSSSAARSPDMKLNQSVPAMSPARTESSARKNSYTEVLTLLQVCCRKAVTQETFTRIFSWIMLINKQFATNLRNPTERRKYPFGRVILAYFLSMMLFTKHVFWLYDRLIYELKVILGEPLDETASEDVAPYEAGVPMEWMPLLRWPRMVLRMAENKHKTGNFEATGIQAFKEAIDSTLWKKKKTRRWTQCAEDTWRMLRKKNVLHNLMHSTGRKCIFG